MKKLIFSWLLSVLFLSVGYTQNGTERTGYDGDFFSLEGALDLFKQSNNLRDFERQLNTERNWVNNLDLNYDGRIDYIRVEHRRQGDFHAIILQALLDRRDIQDVAVIEIEITNRRQAVLQIIGDEDLYGEEVIVEPREGYSDSRRGYSSDYGNFVNVYYWEPVQYILGRQYRVYASPYRWQYYPTYWRPWSPCTWNIFRPRIVVYHRYYHVVRRHRVIRVHNFYRSYRSYSYRVVERTNVVRVRQGRAPIYRDAPNRGRSETRRGNDVVNRPRTNSRSNTPRQSPSVSRKKAEATAGRSATRSSIPRTDQKSRSSISRSGTSRTSAPSQKPSVRSRNSTPSASRSSTRSSSPQVKQPSRSTTTPRSRTSTRSTTPTRQPSVSSRARTSSKPSVSRSTPSRTERTRSSTPSRSRTSTRSTTPTRQPSVSSRTRTSSKPSVSRSTPTRSRTSTRSTPPSRKPSSSVNKRSAPSSKSQSTRSSSSKRSSSSSGSRSRRGGGA